MIKKGVVTWWKQYHSNHIGLSQYPDSDTSCTTLGKLSQVLKKLQADISWEALITVQVKDDKCLKQTAAMTDTIQEKDIQTTML